MSPSEFGKALNTINSNKTPLTSEAREAYLNKITEELAHIRCRSVSPDAKSYWSNRIYECKPNAFSFYDRLDSTTQMVFKSRVKLARDRQRYSYEAKLKCVQNRIEDTTDPQLLQDLYLQQKAILEDLRLYEFRQENAMKVFNKKTRPSSVTESDMEPVANQFFK